MIRDLARNLARPLGLDGLLKQAWVRGASTGETLRFALRGRPAAGDAILLAASGRSGTTWLGDFLSRAAGAQHLFEPLAPEPVDEVQALAGWDDSMRIRSVYLRPDQDAPAWRDFWERVLTGRVRNYWTDHTRTAWFPRTFLVKAIRANLMLGFVHRHFRPRIVHMLRHPCAVVASRLAGDWPADVGDLLAQEALVEDHLRPWLPEIERERDPLGAHAVWWAVENHVAAKQLQGVAHLRVHYEDLVSDRMREVTRILHALDLDPRAARQSDLDRASRTTASVNSRGKGLDAWRSRLDPSEQRRILSWAERFGIDSYGDEALPRSNRSA